MKIIQNPSHLELQKAANQGRRCTWEKLSAIKANCGIELALDECVAILNHMRRLKRSAKRAVAAASHGISSAGKFNGSRRIPSWNCIARDNSTGSLEEEQLTVGPASLHQGVVGGPIDGGSLSGRNPQLHLGVHEGSDSESEATGLNSWTRSGGPLMRTASADMFVEFVRNLEAQLDPKSLRGDSESDNIQTGRDIFYLQSPRVTTPARNPESTETDQSRSSSSIMVAEGDFLQAERSRDGIVFNVLKKDDLNLSGQGQIYNSEIAECLQLECSDKEMDGRSVSEDDDDEDNEGKGPNETTSCEERVNERICADQ